MMSLNWMQLAKKLEGKWHNLEKMSEADFDQIVDFQIDSRKITQGSVFFALKGEHQDGHEYVNQALQKGALFAVTEQAIQTDQPYLQVESVEKALGQMGKLKAQSSKAIKIAITGSQGKTSVKEMLNAIVSTKYRTLCTEGNLNNHLGVPLMLGKIKPDHQVLILEMGANHIGEIAYTAGLLAPDVALVNNVKDAHIGEFGSRDNICQGKSEIYQALSDTGIAILNKDDDYYPTMKEVCKTKHTRAYSIKDHLADPNDLIVTKVKLNQKGQVSAVLHAGSDSARFELPLLGKHHLANLMAAVSIALELEIELGEMVKAIEGIEPVYGRMFPMPDDTLNQYTHAQFIHDAYNASPASIIAAIDFLDELDCKTVLVLGEIKELGEYATSSYQKITNRVKTSNLSILILVGSIYESIYHALQKADKQVLWLGSLDQVVQLKESLKQIPHDATVLIKASRGARLERIFDL